MSDPRKYRTRDEEANEESKDCIDTLENFLMEEHDVTKDAVKQMALQVKTQVRQAVEWAKNSPETPMEELYTDVYADVWGPYLGTSKPEMLEDEGSEQ
jgi:pyruvate dehydrogenase E1 component alpha subunit